MSHSNISPNSPLTGDELRLSEDFQDFVSSYVLRTVKLNKDEKWEYYDIGGESNTIPIICVGDAFMTSVSFFRLATLLSQKGYRVVLVTYHYYLNVDQFVSGMNAFLVHLKLKAAHFYGCGLGGFLLQCFGERYPLRVLSLILLNSFADTYHFKSSVPFSSLLWAAPKFMLKSPLLAMLPSGSIRLDITEAVDFLCSQLETQSREFYLSRLTLLTEQRTIKNWCDDAAKLMILESVNLNHIPQKLLEELRLRYDTHHVTYIELPFPELTQPEELAMYIIVHLRSVGLDPSLVERKRIWELEELEESFVEDNIDSNNYFLDSKFNASVTQSLYETEKIEAQQSNNYVLSPPPIHTQDTTEEALGNIEPSASFYSTNSDDV
eukprot:TRINITY_DN2751_c0_g4_i1.p1 TRINITY_DN2751_c0_g4~~TRINITY_DN2751_c0_g4_i1.p1  ORF type:complete len:387 (-),score=99.02 TRINITY_DN2751_c0_g4_i1:799-1935(-)